MDNTESDLQGYFQAERKRDLEAVPDFETMVRDLVPAASAQGRVHPRRNKVWLLAAASLAAAAVLPFLSKRANTGGGGEVSDSLVGTDAAVDVDELCDAALAALDEHEADWLMAAPTDALLPLGQ